MDKITSDVDFRLSTTNNTSALPLSKRDRSDEPDTYAYPKNTSDVNTVGGDVEILGSIKESKEDQSFEVAKNFQTAESLFNYGKDSLQNLNYSDAETAFRGFVKKYPKDEKAPYVFDIGTGIETSIEELVKLISKNINISLINAQNHKTSWSTQYSFSEETL